MFQYIASQLIAIIVQGIAGRWQFLISSPGCNKTSLESTRTANESKIDCGLLRM